MAGSDVSGGIAGAIVRRRGWIAVAWSAAAIVLLPAAGRVERVLDVAARVEGSESAAVDSALTTRFDSPFARYAVLVVTGMSSPADSLGGAALRTIVDTLRATGGVSATWSYVDQSEMLFVGRDTAGAVGTFVVVGLGASSKPDTLLVGLRAATTRLRALLPSGATLRWTGEIALNADIRRASASDAQRAESRALPLTAGLLIVAFGTLAAAAVPVIAGLLAISLTLGLSVWVAHEWSLSILLQNVVTMLGLGLGVDYSLLVVSRFREALHAGLGDKAAAEDALRHAGPTIALSGAAVLIGFAALATTPVNELRSVAVGGVLVVCVSVLVATTLLPGVLAWLGTRLEAGHVWRSSRPRGRRWGKWGRFVTDRPVLVLALAGVPMCALALQAHGLRTELPRGDWLPHDMESATALRQLIAMRRGAAINSIRVLVELPGNALGDESWASTNRIAVALTNDSAVASVRSLPGLLAPMETFVPRRALFAALPAGVRRTFVSRDSQATMFEVIPREDASPAELMALVARIRAIDVKRISVGGLPAFNADYEAAVAGRFFRIVSLIVGATFMMLAVGFRSLLVPFKAIVLNLLAVAGAFGAVKLVFQDGIGASLLGLSGPLDAIFPAIPILVFCIVFGLSMDYEVFLVARVREARRSGLDERAAIVEGLERTGGIITSAAAIMIVVFGAFTFGGFLVIKMLGFALATAVLLDATVMRLAVGPALLALAGRWNWWPGELRPPGRRTFQSAGFSRKDPGQASTERR